MQIVIDISKEDYKRVSTIVDMGLGTNVDEAIKNGVLIPKGHGRLIDADALYEQYVYADYDFDMTMAYAPTIIEADEEQE